MRTETYADIGALDEEMMPEEFDAASRAAVAKNVSFVLLTTPKGTRVWVEAPQLPKPPVTLAAGN